MYIVCFNKSTQQYLSSTQKNKYSNTKNSSLQAIQTNTTKLSNNHFIFNYLNTLLLSTMTILAINESFFQGLEFCIGFQFIILSFFYFIKKKHVEFGVICFILGTNAFYNLDFIDFLSVWENILFADYRSMVIPALFFIYISKKINNTNKQKHYYKHLIIPVTVILIYMVFKFAFTELYKTHLSTILIWFWTSGLLIISFYTFLLFKTLIKSQHILYKIVYKRYLLICGLISSHLLVGVIALITELLNKLDIPNLFEHYLYSRSFIKYHVYFIVGNLPIMAIAIIELDSIKKYIINNTSIHNQFNTIKNEASIQEFIEKEIISLKRFKNKDFDAKQLIRDFNINEKEFRLFLKREHEMTISEYINHLKIQEFINVSKTTSMDKYDIEGLALIAGFHSKSTFYRVFKKEMKITPREYIDSF